ncbi:MAG TPA: SRPBCC domain-containing protein [bacterium]|nr:SRPBCC domain-containing protein [bacterium]
MRFEKKIAVARSPDAVWQFLWDVERVARCLPGCREARTVVPHERYAAVVGERIGPFSVTFPLEIQILEVDEGRRLRAQAAGRDSAMGSSLRVTLDLAVEPRGDGSVLHIVSDAAVLGRLGTLGQGMIQRKADQIMEQFAAAIREALEVSA